MRSKTVLKAESFAFFENSRFMTTEYFKTRITVLALPIRGLQFFVLPSIIRECYLKMFERFHLFQ